MLSNDLLLSHQKYFLLPFNNEASKVPRALLYIRNNVSNKLLLENIYFFDKLVLSTSSMPSNVSSDVSGNRDVDSYETRVLREYYTDSELFLSTEWILKVLAVVACIASSSLFLWGGGCGGASGLAAGGAAAAAAAAAASALLCAGAAAQLPARAPRVWMLADITISSGLGVLVLVSTILSIVFCDMTVAAGYLLGALGIAATGLMTGSAVATYAAVTRRLDAAQPREEPRRPPPQEQEV